MAITSNFRKHSELNCANLCCKVTAASMCFTSGSGIRCWVTSGECYSARSFNSHVDGEQQRGPGSIRPPPTHSFFSARRQVKLPVIKRHPADFTPPEQCNTLPWWISRWHLSMCNLVDTHCHSCNMSCQGQHFPFIAVLASAVLVCLHSVWLCSGATLWREMPVVSSLGGVCALCSRHAYSLSWATC